jgi:hypothetical protein
MEIISSGLKLEDVKLGEIWETTKDSFVVFLGGSELEKFSPKVGVEVQTLMLDIAHLRDWTDEYKSKFWVLEVKPNSDNMLSEPMYIDCSNTFGASSNSFEKLAGNVNEELVRNIIEVREKFWVYESNMMDTKRFEPRDIEKFDYDITLSFAGEDRLIVSQVAENLKKSGVRVFYDEFEKSNLWGKDLVQHLDYVYRSKSQYCIIFVSKHYASKIWTNHELKSALARSITQNEEYILPIQLDSTELPGIRPTVGYISIQTEEDVGAVNDLIIDKLNNRNLINYAEFSSKWLENILDINRMWDLDCLAFCLDSRFLDSNEGWQDRIAISYGINSTSPRSGILAPPEQGGSNVFGIHCVATKDNKLCLTDRWHSSSAAKTYERIEDVIKEMYETLANIPDKKYFEYVNNMDSKGAISLSEKYLLDEFTISTEVG